MLNFKEELKKYQPLMELDDIQSALQDTSASQAEEA